MKLLKTLPILLLTVSFFINISAVNAQSTTVELIVETDLDERIPNHPITCTKSKISLNLSETLITQTYDLLTDENGKTELIIDEYENISYRCESAKILTNDNCWFFSGAKSLQFSGKETKIDPIYFIGIETKNTCNKELSEEDIENINELLPQGTPMPYRNKQLQPKTIPTPEIISSQLAEDQEELTLIQWFIHKIKSMVAR